MVLGDKMSMHELKSIDLASFTIISTGISVLYALLFSIIIGISIVVSVPAATTFAIYLIPTVVVGTLIFTIYNSFFDGFLYNVLGKKLKRIKIGLNGGEISKISAAQAAIIVSIIITIQAILIYLASILIFPLMLNTVIQTFAYAGQQALAFTLYQFMMFISQPQIIIIFFAATFVVTFVYVLISILLYNFLASKGRGIVVNLSKEGNFTAIDSVDVLKVAIVFAIIVGILTLINTALSAALSGGYPVVIVLSIIGGFINGFVEGALVAIFYNFLAQRLGKLKIELIEE